MKNLFKTLVVAVMMVSILSPAAFAGSESTTGEVTGKTIGAGLLSLIVWPGIGQAINNAPEEKVVTHAVLGLLGIPRLWSCYDAVVDRKGGYWEGRI